MAIGKMKSIFIEMVNMIIDENFDISSAIKVVSTNVANILKLPYKGYIKEGFDADLVLLDKDYKIFHLLARGKFMIKNKSIINKGIFEK